MIIAIDLDGVVINTVQALIKQFNLDITHSQITKYEIEDIERLKLTKKQVCTMFEDILPENVELYPNVITGIGLILSKGHKIYFLTNKTPKMIMWTGSVLKRNHLSSFKLVVDSKKHEHQFNILVEDKGDTARICKLHHKKCVLIDRPWNQGYDVPRYRDLLHFAQSL